MVRDNYQYTEIGIIPNDWIIKKIKAFTDATSGGTPSTFIPEYWNGSIRWMNSGELNLRKVYEVRGRITELGLKNSSTKNIPKNCILIGLAGQGKTRGTVAINYVELCINQSICAILPNKYFIPEYLYYNLDSRYDELRNLSTGEGGRGGLNLTIIKNIGIPFPPTIEEQSVIAKIISDTDELIQQLDHLIIKKKNIKQGAMQELLTGKRRLSGFKDEWEVVNFGDIVEHTKGFAFKSKDYTKNGVRIIRVSDTTFTSIKDENEIFIEKNNAKHYRKWELKEDDLVFSTVGSKPPMYDSLVGRVIIVNQKYQGCLLNQNAVIIRLKNKTKLKQHLLLSHFRTKRYLQFIEMIYRGNANQASITLNDLFKFSLPLPKDLKEQSAIAEILLDMDTEIEELEKNRDKYIMIKNGMMQKLLTGEIRVK